ncbi:MAG: hypothetical protein ACOYL9_00770 [Ilumatobacteraceae bacterium]
MFDSIVLERLSAVAAGGLGHADSTLLAEAVGLVAKVRCSLDAFEIEIANRTAVLHAAGKSEAPDSMLARNGRTSVRNGRKVARRAAATARTPKVRDALAKGDVTAAHADALATAASRLTDDQKDELFEHDEDLAARAAKMSPERFQDHLRQLIGTITADEGASEVEDQRKQTRLTKYVDPRTGMYHLNGVFDPELGAVMFKAIDDQTRAMIYAKDTADLGGVVESKRTEWDHVAAHALGALIRGGRTRTTGVQAEMIILIDADTITNGVHDHTHCATPDNTPIAVASARRLLCTAVQHLAITGMNGQILELGTATAQPNRAQRRALQAMYATCAFDGCDTPFSRCEIHHVHFRRFGGPTDLANLLPLCVRHHHTVHEGGWSITLTDDRTIRIWRPDGQHHRDIPFQPVITSPNERTRERERSRQPASSDSTLAA